MPPKKILKQRTVQDALNDLTPYLRSIVIDEENEYQPIVYMVAYPHWELPEDNDISINVTSMGNIDELEIYALNKAIMFDELIAFIFDNIIVYNEILEEKKEEIQKNIERIELEKQREIEEMKKALLSGPNHRTQQSAPIKKKETPETYINQNIPQENFGEKIVVSIKDIRNGNIGEPQAPEIQKIHSEMLTNNAFLLERDTE